jgi:hypothetical protein
MFIVSYHSTHLYKYIFMYIFNWIVGFMGELFDWILGVIPILHWKMKSPYQLYVAW